MARGSSLSDNRVIEAINRDFIAVDNNISDQGWPANTPALEPWHMWLDNHPTNTRNGFTTSVVTTPDGRVALGTSGSGYIAEWHTSVCYDPQKYFGFLQGGLEKYRRLQSIASMPNANERNMMSAQLERDIRQENRSRSHPEARSSP